MKWPILLRRKPTFIRAMQWTGENYSDLKAWGAPVTFLGVNDEDAGNVPDPELWLWVAANGAQLKLEVGEWIAKDELGFYPIKDCMIVKNYDVVDHE